MNAMAGFDARDSTSLERPAEDYGRDLNLDLSGLRIGLPKECPPFAFTVRAPRRMTGRRSCGSWVCFIAGS